MIDDRYPPQPLETKVPLYKDVIISGIEPAINLQKFIASKHQLNEQNILLAESATNALISFLTVKFQHKKKIALPAFFCAKVAYELYKSGYELLFYDLISIEDANDANLEFILKNKAEIVVLPSLFCCQEWDYQVIERFLTAGLIVIMDIAHTFPVEQPINTQHDNLITLFSFGKNKPIATSGGGGIYYHGTIMPKFDKSYKPQSLTQVPSRIYTNMLSNLNNTLTKQIDLIFKGYLPLSKQLEKEILWSYELFFNKSASMRSYLNGCFDNKSSLSHLKFSKGDLVNTIAIRHKSRFKLASLLSKRGIQVTWYYYPLPLINLFKDCIFTDLSKSIEASSEILVLPFSIHHTETEINYVIDSLMELCLC